MADVGRIPPHNLDAERAVLGALLTDATRVFPTIGHLRPGDFYNPSHQLIAGAAWHLAEHDHHVDTITVGEHLRTSGHLDGVGGTTYIHGLIADTPSISAAHHYAAIVANTAALRHLIHSAARITDYAYTSDTPAAALAAAAELLTQAAASNHLTDLSTLEVADVGALIGNGLTVPDPDLLTRSDGAALLYAGMVHALQAEPSAGKTWIALAAVGQVLDMGGAALFIDNEDTAVGILSRCLTIGIPPDALADRFRYVQPAGKLGPPEMASLQRLVEDLNPDLVIIDGVGASMQREGLDENSAPDYYRWFGHLPQPLARSGAAVILIDHLVKDKEQQLGRYGRGSGAKLAAIDGAAYNVRPVIPFSRHKAGSSKLIIAKDKPGGVGAIGEQAALVGYEPHADGERLIVRIDPAPTTAPGDAWKPTGLMAKVSRELAASPNPLSASQLRALVDGKRTLVGQAIQRLIAEGYVREATHGRRTVLEQVRPYHDPTGIDPHSPPPPDPEPRRLFVVPEPPEHALHPPIWETHPDDF